LLFDPALHRDRRIEAIFAASFLTVLPARKGDDLYAFLIQLYAFLIQLYAFLIQLYAFLIRLYAFLIR
jgi:hypothetical protein